MHFRLVSVMAVALLPTLLFSQSYLKGTIYKAGAADSVISGATIVNLTQNLSATSANDGSYSIAAELSDLVLFSSVGFIADTVKVEDQLLVSGYDPSLGIDQTMLERVVVKGNYESDSLQRREQYREIYENRTGITGGNTPVGFGISLSPISYFSKGNRQKRTLRKRLIKQVENAYVDYVFPASWVSYITGLKSDSLKLFMYTYRPSYKFCRDSDRTALTLYVNEKLKEFRKPD